MILSSITELRIAGVYDRGIANKECIILQANQTINLGQFGLMLGYSSNGFANPYNDNLLWFGDGWVQKGDWVFIYTGPGQARTDDIPNQTQKMYTIYWGRNTTVFAHSQVAPILFRADAIQIAEPPSNIPQLNLSPK